MADFTDKAQEAVGRAKEAAGDLTGNDDLKADGAADTAEAKVKQGVDAVAEKAGDAVDAVADRAGDAADAVRQLHLDEAASTLGDKRVVVGVVVAAVLLAVVVRRRRQASRNPRTAATRVAKAGIGRALTRC